MTASALLLLVFGCAVVAALTMLVTALRAAWLCDRRAVPAAILLPDGVAVRVREKHDGGNAIVLEIYRASGDVICETCGRALYQHPLDRDVLDYENRPFLRVLCNGDRVKL